MKSCRLQGVNINDETRVLTEAAINAKASNLRGFTVEEETRALYSGGLTEAPLAE